MDPDMYENFPRLFPRPPTINNLESIPSESIIPGDHGRSISECDSSSDVIICDDKYLVSLVRKIKSIELKLQMWDAKCKKLRGGIRRYAAKSNPSTLLRQVLTELVEVTSHVKRLRDNPVLFGDSRVRELFFITTISIFQAMAQFLGRAKMLRGFAAKAETEKRERFSSTPTRTEDNERIPPWLSFCAPEKRHHSKEIQAIHEKAPRLQFLFTQVLPPQGVLIQEYWRLQVNGFARDIASASRDPNRTLAMRVEPKTYTKKCVKVVRDEEKSWCQITKRAATAFHTGLNGQKPAFGEQDPVAVGRSSRLIAKLLGERTTAGGPPSIVTSKFMKIKD